MADIAARLADLDWTTVERSLWEWGYARTPPLLTPDECAGLIAMYADETRFRSRIDMARYRFGVGEYKYFDAPLPPLVQDLRTHAYPPLAAIANQFEVALDTATLHPADLAGLQAICRRRGQTKPTPLLLHYEAGGYRTSTATSCFRYSSPASSVGAASTTRAATSCSSSSGPAHSRAARPSLPSRARS